MHYSCRGWPPPPPQTHVWNHSVSRCARVYMGSSTCPFLTSVCVQNKYLAQPSPVYYVNLTCYRSWRIRSAGEEEICLRHNFWCPVVLMCHYNTHASIHAHNKTPTAAYIARNASIWNKSSGPIYKSRNSVLQQLQRTQVRNSAQISRVEPGPVSALSGHIMNKWIISNNNPKRYFKYE